MTGYRQQKPKNGLTKCPDLVDHYTFLTQGFTWPIYLELALAVAAIKYVQQAATEVKATAEDHQEATRLPAVPPKGARG
ncbi:hypothetical protein [Aeromonas veronii]|uniref:hypothetical protein n=1 Tax=Aeromonas veronii TaxID=654 RepID=UPI001F315B6F|nr:hypothetical protein [Aeromonas veronii]TNI94332.1 hypothetical protein CF114_17230 [Aeromonas veronii]